MAKPNDPGQERKKITPHKDGKDKHKVEDDPYKDATKPVTDKRKKK